MAAALVVAPVSARAESLMQAFASAYANNPNIASALLAVKSSAEDIVRAKSGLLPQIGAGADMTHQFQIQNGTYADGQTFTLGLNYRQTLLDHYATDAAVEQARAFVELSSQALRNAEQNVLLSVAQAYMSVIRDTQLVQLRQENVTFFQAQVSSANDRLRIGEGTKIDVSQAQARLAQAVAAYQTAIFQLQTSQASYERWVGHKPQGLSSSFDFRDLLPQSIDDAIMLSEVQHPAILSAKAAIRAAQAGSDGAAAAFGPTLDLIGQLCAIQCFGATQDPGVSGSVRLTLSIPLYAGGTLGAGMRKANLEQIKSEVDAMATYDQVREAVITSWSTLQNAKAQIESANAAVASGNLVLEGVIQERDVGQRTTLDVLNAQAELTAAREALIAASTSKLIAAFSLIASTGRLSAAELQLPVEIKTGEGYIARVEDVWAELRSIDE
jgi:outer membrane protein